MSWTKKEKEYIKSKKKKQEKVRFTNSKEYIG